MTIRRSFLIDTCDPDATLQITELPEPETCLLTINFHGQDIPVRLTKKQFESLASLNSYSNYSRFNIEWVAPPRQPELPLGEPPAVDTEESPL